MDCEVFTFIGGIGRAEEVEAGGAADIHGALAGVFEVAFFHRDLAGATFELDAGAGGEAGFTDEVASGDERLVAADEVDPLPSPAADSAVADGEFAEAAAFDGIMISLGADVADVEMIERDAFHRTRAFSTVVEVDAVRALAADFEVAEGESLAAGELERAVATIKVRRLTGVECFEREVVDTDDVLPAEIVAGGEFQDSTGLEIVQSGFERGGIFDGDISRMSAGKQGKAVGENAHDTSTLGEHFHSRMKTCFPLGSRHQTGVFFAKEAVAVLRYEGVGEVAQGTGDDLENPEPGEASAHEFGDLQSGIAFGKDALGGDEDHAVRLCGIEAMLTIEL